MFGLLVAAGEKARKFPPLGWMAVYLFLIPLFGLAYWIYGPTGFSHATRALEPQFVKETIQLQDDLRLEFLTSLDDLAFVDFESARLSPLSCRFDIRSASSQDGEIRIPFSIGAARGITDPKLGWVRSMDHPVFDLQVDFVMRTAAKETPDGRRFHRVKIQGTIPEGIDLSRLFPRRPVGSNNGDNWLLLHEWTSTRVAGRAKELQGYGGSTSLGDLVTMMYFSAVTITTLGYGDIAPVTSTARMMAAVEAVLGLIIIGLFLNSLGSRPISKDVGNSTS